MPDIKLSAGINFGKPETEFIVESTPQGVATSCRNVRTNTEYIGGGGGGSDFTTAEVTLTLAEGGFNGNNPEGDDIVALVKVGNDFYHVYDIYEVLTAEPFEILFLHSTSSMRLTVNRAYGTPTITGNATYTQDAYETTVTITGDCTIIFATE